MDIFVTVIALVVLFALVLAAPVTWWLRDRAGDRQIARAGAARARGAVSAATRARWAELHRATWSRDAWALTRGDGRD
ncbi:hypothetical protein [Streptomyces tremellae]